MSVFSFFLIFLFNVNVYFCLSCNIFQCQHLLQGQYNFYYNAKFSFSHLQQFHYNANPKVLGLSSSEEAPHPLVPLADVSVPLTRGSALVRSPVRPPPSPARPSRARTR